VPKPTPFKPDGDSPVQTNGTVDAELSGAANAAQQVNV
jgi:hypothetical protein